MPNDDDFPIMEPVTPSAKPTPSKKEEDDTPAELQSINPPSPPDFGESNDSNEDDLMGFDMLAETPESSSGLSPSESTEEPVLDLSFESGFGDLSEPATEEPIDFDDKPADFQESTNAFEDIRSFGEGLDGEQQAASPPTIATPSATSQTKTIAQPGISPTGLLPISSSDELAGYKINGICGAVSGFVDIDSKATNPLAHGFANLSSQASAMGAQAITALRVQMTPDGNKALLIGTAVQCTKKE